MRKIVLCSIVLLASGCAWFQAPAPVQQARQTRTSAIESYAVNSQALIAFALDCYRKAEYSKADALYDQAILQCVGPLTGPAAIAAQVKVENDKHAKNYAAVDAQVAKFNAIVLKAQTDPVIALKLDEALSQFESAGIDPGAAAASVDGILAIIKQLGGQK